MMTGSGRLAGTAGHRVCAIAMMLAAVLATGACTLTTGGQDPTAAPSGTTSGAGSSTTLPPSSSPSGPSADELSADLLARADSQAQAAPVASVTAQVEDPQKVPAAITLDVMQVRRTPDGTLVRLRLSSDRPGYLVGGSALATDGITSVNFVREILLDDPVVSASRYRPLSFVDDLDRGTGCLCPLLPLTLGPQPQDVSVLFPTLPGAVTTVTFRWGSTGLVLEGVPVAD